ncbi:MAG: 4Fe-4S dicluster domain-containing protein [Syntrophales bacterium]|jgi:Pyruvate/2-oxoacid:ferredoxin oxidoreductase delta subunit|nr:4Fe-4S dicluster domain-containing protein [Syntrophales bacterium]MDD4339494.1 4Fe-4S dicluster domain-containing protein [Syntrophales bacterium]HOG07150.1 4Fe-4S dicluster domain-containing protein [Syntrophales bacterium]HOS76458.1 4Fe-4S dicluster domain-containing protein [Syntrophales bacterium]HPB70742.1 4Fe-4S dicluster domain-containing protein [Syntrophales bacterium]
MENPEEVYIELRKHLDQQAVGFPATKSGVEIRILKHFFAPKEARLALHLNYQPRSALDIHNSIEGADPSLEKLTSMLEEMSRKGAIGTMEKNRTEYFYTMPLLVGMVELKDKFTPQFGVDLAEYMMNGFILSYMSTRVPQMRTIPVEKSIEVEHRITPYDDIRQIINRSEGPIALIKCMCREGALARGKPCRTTSRLETCLNFGDWGRFFIKTGRGREVTRQEALEILRLNEADGLVLQPSNYQKVDFVCACCGCCCGILNIQKKLPNPAESWSHNYYSTIHAEDCTPCGICAAKCQMKAIAIDPQSGYPAINLDRCIGCGNCVSACPTRAFRLVKVERETVPPEDRTSLYRRLAERAPADG